MKKVPLIILLALVMTACTDHSSNSSQIHQVVYDSEIFMPALQHKKHKISAYAESTDHASLSFQVSGSIIKEYVNVGDTVNKGDSLFEISNPILAPKITQIDEEITALAADIAQNQTELKRLANLKKTNAISQNDLDKLIYKNESLNAKKRSLEAQRLEARSLFEETVLHAPFTGTVAEIFKKNGEMVNIGEPVALLSGVNSLQASIFVPSHLQNALHREQKIPAYYHDSSFLAVIKEISQTANPKSQLFKIIIELPSEITIKAGEQITTFIPEELGTHYSVPFESVIDDGINKPYLMVLHEQQVKQAFIKIIALREDEILLDLETDISHNKKIEVITQGQSHLTIGQHVKSKEKNS